MFVPLTHDGVRGWLLNLVCPGNAMSVSHGRQLLVKNASLNRNLGFDNVCKEKRVHIAYNEYPKEPKFSVNSKTGELVKYPVNPVARILPVAHEWEIQTAFFESNNIIPFWTNCNMTWGSLNGTTGQWTGTVGMVQRDEADYAIPLFGVNYARSKVVAFSPPSAFHPQRWLSRYPRKLSPIWNLVGLFQIGCSSQYFQSF